MGVVYRGLDLSLNRPIAIKAMLTTEADPGVLARFMREARALASVAHGGLVPVYAVGREGGSYYMVMRFIEGQSLQEILQTGTLSSEETCSLLFQVSEALGALHQAKLIHRDIKPGNLIRDADGLVTVMDLGIVKTVGEHTSSMALGTPRYMAPESLSSIEIDGRADLYSLGVIAYQALCGEVPFDGPTPMSILYKQAHEAHIPLRKRLPLSRGLEQIIERLLDKDPERRFPSTAALSAAVKRLEQGALQPQRRWSPSLILGGVALLLGLLALLLFAPLNLLSSESVDLGSPASDIGLAKISLGSRLKDMSPPEDLTPIRDAGPVQDLPPPDAAPVQRVKIQLRSDPKGAKVSSQGRFLGRTPLSLRRSKSRRSLKLRFQRQGYEEVLRRGSLQRDQQIRVKLQPIFELVP